MTARPENPSPASLLAAALASGEDVADTHGMGLALMYHDGGWPSYFVEQSIGGLQNLTVVGEELIGYDLIHDTLIKAGMTAVRNAVVPPEPSYDGPLRFLVQRRDNRRRPAGIYGPGPDNKAGGLTIISPLPPWLPAFDEIVPAYGWQMGIYLTTQSDGLWKLHGDPLFAALAAEGDAGRLLGARAAVI